MHEEDNNALKAVNKVLPKISELIEAIAPKIEKEEIILHWCWN